MCGGEREERECGGRGEGSARAERGERGVGLHPRQGKAGDKAATWHKIEVRGKEGRQRRENVG
eukprot:38457-Chlamydomonas_euryale.AAC.14